MNSKTIAVEFRFGPKYNLFWPKTHSILAQNAKRMYNRNKLNE